MRRDLDHLREEATRARWWAVSVFDPGDRERLENIAREYEQIVRTEEDDRRRDGAEVKYRLS